MGCPRPTTPPTVTVAATGSYVVLTTPWSTTTTPRPARTPANVTVPSAEATTVSPGLPWRSTPRWPAPQVTPGGSKRVITGPWTGRTSEGRSDAADAVAGTQTRPRTIANADATRSVVFIPRPWAADPAIRHPTSELWTVLTAVDKLGRRARLRVGSGHPVAVECPRRSVRTGRLSHAGSPQRVGRGLWVPGSRARPDVGIRRHRTVRGR